MNINKSELMTIAEFRKSQCLTQEQFAALIGNSVSAVRDWEQKRTKPDRRSRIALKKVGYKFDD